MFNNPFKVSCDVCHLSCLDEAGVIFGDTIICYDCQEDIRNAIFYSSLFHGTFFYRFLANNYLWLAHEYNENLKSDKDILVAKFCRFVKDNDFYFG